MIVTYKLVILQHHSLIVSKAAKINPRVEGFGYNLTFSGEVKNFTPVTDENLLKPDPADWLMIRGNYQAWSHSSLAQITPENVCNLQVLQRAFLLVIGVISIPHRLRRLGRIVRRFHRARQQHRAEDGGSAPRPPFRHLINRFAGISLNLRDLVDRQDREIHLDAGLRAVGVGEIDGLHGHRPPGADRFGDLLRQLVLG